MDSNLKIAIILSAVDKVSSVVNKMTMSATKNLDAFAKKTSAISDSAFKVGRQAGAIGLAIGVPLTYAIKQASDLQESVSKTQAVFKKGSDEVIKWSKTTGKAFGQSQQDALEAASTFGNLFQAFGLGQDKAQGMSTSLTQLASDLASFNNTSVEQAIISIRSGLSGETEPLKKYGVILSDVRLKQAALSLGLIKSTKEAMTPATKSLAAYKLLMTDTKIAQGDFARTSNQLANQQRILKAQLTNVTTQIGVALIPTITNILNKLTPVIDKIALWVQKNPQLVETIAKVVGGLAVLALATSGISFLVGGVFKAVSLFSGALSFLTSTLGFVAKAFNYLGGVIRIVTMFMMANPIIAIITAVAIAALLIYKYWDPIKAFFISLWSKVKDVFSSFWEWVKTIPIISTVVKIIQNWDKIKSFFANLWGNVKEKFMSFVTFVATIPQKMYTAGVNIVKSIWEGIKSFANKPIDAIKNIAKKIRDFLPFSPAKEGALRDIHKIKLVETIAATIKPGPMVKAMRVTAAATALAASPLSAGAASGSAGGGINFNYSPTITVSGGSPTAIIDFRTELQKHSKDIMKMFEEAQRKQSRTKF